MSLSRRRKMPMFISIVEEQERDVDRIISTTKNVEEVQQTVVTWMVCFDHWLIMSDNRWDVAEEEQNEQMIRRTIHRHTE